MLGKFMNDFSLRGNDNIRGEHKSEEKTANSRIF